MRQFVEKAGEEKCDLVCFDESVLPGYPFWLMGLNSMIPFRRKFMLAIKESVTIEKGHLDGIKAAAKKGNIMVVLGMIERPLERRNHSLYCSVVKIDRNGEILSVHRKLMPTYEERLAWSIGDGHGLVTHPLGPFTVGALNCWENWMPLARVSLYNRGENLHVAVWPGADRNTKDHSIYGP